MVTSPRELSDIYADNFAATDNFASADSPPQPFATTDPLCLVQCQQWINSHLSMAGFLSSKHQGVSVLQEAPDAAAATLNILHMLLLQREADADSKSALQGQLSKHRMDADCAHKKVQRLEGDIEQQHTSNATLMIKVRKLGDQGKAKDAVWLQKQQESVREVSRLKSAVASQERDARKSERETAELRTQLQRRVFGAAGSSSCSPPRGGATMQDGSVASHGRPPVFGRGSLPAQHDVGGATIGLGRTRSTPEEAQRPASDARKLEIEQLKAQVSALKGEVLHLKQQHQGVSAHQAPGTIVNVAPAFCVGMSESAQTEASAKAADPRALQLCSEQLKASVQKLAEKEQLLVMSRKALSASDALVATKATEVAASAQKAASQQRLLKQLQGRLAVLGSERDAERSSSQRQAAAMVKELRNMQMDLDISLRQCTAAEEDVAQGHSRVSELEAVNEELRSLLDRSRRQQQHGRQREQSSQQRAQAQRQQHRQQDTEFSARHDSPSETSSDLTNPPQLDAEPDMDTGRLHPHSKHYLRASMTCLPNPLFASPYSSSNTPFSSIHASSAIAGTNHRTPHLHNNSHTNNNHSSNSNKNTSGTPFFSPTSTPLTTSVSNPMPTLTHTPHTSASTGSPSSHPLVTSFSHPVPTLHPSTHATQTSTTTGTPNSSAHPLSASTAVPTLSPSLHQTTFSRSMLHDRPVSHSLSLLRVSHSGPSGCLSASGRRMWEVQDPLLHPHVTPRQLLIDEELADTADSRGSFSSGGEGNPGDEGGTHYSLDGYAKQEVGAGDLSEAAGYKTAK